MSEQNTKYSRLRPFSQVLKTLRKIFWNPYSVKQETTKTANLSRFINIIKRLMIKCSLGVANITNDISFQEHASKTCGTSAQFKNINLLDHGWLII